MIRAVRARVAARNAAGPSGAETTCRRLPAMTDLPLILLVATFIAIYAIRLLMLSEMRRWSSEQKARLIDAFYRQNKLTSLVLIGAMALMILPTLLGARSILFALVMSLVAAGVALVGGAVGNLKLRRLGFPRRYVTLHAILFVTMSSGMVAFTVLIVA